MYFSKFTSYKIKYEIDLILTSKCCTHSNNYFLSLANHLFLLWLFKAEGKASTEVARATPRPPPEGSSEVDGGNDVTDGLSLSRPAATVADDSSSTANSPTAPGATEAEQLEDMKHLQSILSIKVNNFFCVFFRQ